MGGMWQPQQHYSTAVEWNLHTAVAS
jgi:hypothetical protein